ncbi:hypothetical protein L218DRAFT_79010 [Marasmius fiardii PR-910]|nr:hypothetical protein L218DRAFT_79010 [Marasmius fiardii PR-910]
MASFSSTPRCTLPRRPVASLRLYSISEESITECEEVIGINLGAESPKSILNEEPSFLPRAPVLPVSPREGVEDMWRKSGIAVHTNVPMRDRNWRSSSFTEKLRKRPQLYREFVDRDCGICCSFEVAVSPCRILCCGKLFCFEHLSEWLCGADSEGRCPSCEVPCSLNDDVLSLASPALRSAPSSPTNSLCSTTANSISSQYSSLGGRYPKPQTDSSGLMALMQGESPRATPGAAMKSKVGKNNSSSLPERLEKRATSPSFSRSDEEAERRKDTSLKTFHRRMTKSSLIFPNRYSRRRHPTTNTSPKPVFSNVSHHNSIKIARRPQKVGLGSELAVSSVTVMCGIQVVRIIGRLLSVVGLVILFWVLLT